jgi:hypothetical protein
MAPQLSLESQLCTVQSSPEASFKEINPKMASLSSLRRSISFADDRNEVFLIPTSDELSDEEYDAVWYASTDYREIKNSCLEMGKRIASGLPEDETNCYRGLEFLGSKALRQRRSLNRRRATMAVFLEQEKQWEKEGCSSQEESSSQEEIASEYNSCTCHCQSEAFRRGILDAKIALEAVNENESSSKDMPLAYNSSDTCESPRSMSRSSPQSRSSPHSQRIKALPKLRPPNKP